MATPNTVYAREVAQLFVSGRHNQFRDATTRFGSLEGSRTMSSRALLAQAQAPTPSLPSSESIGDFACQLLPELPLAPVCVCMTGQSFRAVTLLSWP